MTFPKLPFNKTKLPYGSTKSPHGPPGLLENLYGCSYMATQGPLGPRSKNHSPFTVGSVNSYSTPTNNILYGTLPAGGYHHQLLPKLKTFNYHEGIGGLPSETKLTPPRGKRRNKNPNRRKHQINNNNKKQADMWNCRKNGSRWGRPVTNKRNNDQAFDPMGKTTPQVLTPFGTKKPRAMFCDDTSGWEIKGIMNMIQNAQDDVVLQQAHLYDAYATNAAVLDRVIEELEDERKAPPTINKTIRLQEIMARKQRHEDVGRLVQSALESTMGIPTDLSHASKALMSRGAALYDSYLVMKDYVVRESMPELRARYHAMAAHGKQGTSMEVTGGNEQEDRAYGFSRAFIGDNENLRIAGSGRGDTGSNHQGKRTAAQLDHGTSTATGRQRSHSVALYKMVLGKQVLFAPDFPRTKWRSMAQETTTF